MLARGIGYIGQEKIKTMLESVREKLKNLVGHKYVNRRVILLIDTVLSLLGSCCALFFGYSLFSVKISMGVYILSSLIVSLAFLLLWRTSQELLRHGTLYVIRKIFLFSITKFFALLLIISLIYWIDTKILFLMVLDVMFSFILLLGFRAIVVETMRWVLSNGNRVTNTLVFGLDDNTIGLVQKLKGNVLTPAKILGIITSSAEQTGYLGKVRVYNISTSEQLVSLLERLSIKRVVFNNYNTFEANKSLAQVIMGQSVKIFVEQDPMRLSKIDTPRPVQEIEIEDLLGREQIFLNMEPIRNYLRERVVLVTGAAGSIGSEIVRQMASLGAKHIVAFDLAETPTHNLSLELKDKYPNQSFSFIVGDVRSLERIDYVMKRFRPQVVYHAAAYKHVPLMESNPCEAVLANVAGTYNVACKCTEYKVEKMVMVSTDKAVDPTNVMGATKRACEKIIQSMDYAIKNKQLNCFPTQFVTTRFGNVLGSNGSVIPLFKQQILSGGPITVTDERITRYFMTIPEACQLVLEAGMMSQGGEIFVFDMGEPVKIKDLAEKMIRLSGLEPGKDIKIEYVGLRPGEKLYEELLNDGESNLPTSHPKITVAKTRFSDYKAMVEFIPTLLEAASLVELGKTVLLLKQFVPEYKSNNSAEYEAIDRQLEEASKERNFCKEGL